MKLCRRFPMKLQQKMFSSKTTIDPQEIALFEKLTANWWDSQGPLKPLHAMNTLRVPLVRNGLINQGVVSKENIYSCTPLKGLSILDVGCGGGILSEALARLGAQVTGIDANPSAIDLAKHHALKNNLSINYLFTSIEEHAMENIEKYDAITASEVIEHVTNKEPFLDACVECLKPSGSMFMTTMNKTIFTEVFAIYAAENIFDLIPKGTHQIEKCIEPEQLQRILEKNYLQTKEIRGMFYNFLTNEWCWCLPTWISYSLHAVKPKERGRFLQKQLIK
ncbi:unnamed protein product [Ceutorhynchus assimilis]|uniref:Ubiquinone biosynthesis O-methyltransferase, mitochondrial n=1 Tax=Ceutorhynchus assimilis TaxID=467358 RepID=A0A9N9MP50_9CUCU|nr:unnamed protein product [Ceutorhynchus assimilis]